MRQDEGFLGAVCDSPGDDTTRLVYADWLEERGDPRAEFVRVQYALAGLAEGDERRYALEARARQLLWQHGKGWAGPLRRLVRRYAFRRGFVEDVALSADAFLRRGEELLRLAPIRRVRLLDARDRLAELAASPLLGRLVGLDLRHTEGLDVERSRPLLRSPHLAGLRELGLRGTGLCSGPGLRALAACPYLAGLTELDLSDYRRDAGIGQRRLRRERGWRAAYSQRENSGATDLDVGAMRALVESPHLQGLRALRLGGYGLGHRPLPREALDVLLGSSLLAGLTELDLSFSRFEMDEESQPPSRDRPTLLEVLGRSPRAAGLRTLRLRRVRALRHHGPLAPLPHLAGLTGLELEDEPASGRCLVGMAEGAFPNLRWLRLRGCHTYDVQPLPLARLVGGSRQRPLTALDLRESTHGPELVQALVEGGSLLEGLRWLSLSNAGGYESSPVGGEAVRLLADCPAAARLAHLDLTNNHLDDAAAAALALSPYLGLLASLMLGNNRIGAAGAAALASSPSLAALAFVDLRANPLSVAAQAPLRRRFGPGVRYGAGPRIQERPPPVNRSPSPEDALEPPDGGERFGGDEIPF